jgi:hypothetical protein
VKLVLCVKCWDVFKLARVKWRFCGCKLSYGKYREDGINAEYGGPCAPLGMANGSLAHAVMHQPDDGLGREFEAFVIPKECPTMKRITQYPVIDELAELKAAQTDIEDRKRKS